MCKKPTTNKNDKPETGRIDFHHGPFSPLVGQSFTIRAGSINRITGQGPTGKSLLLETLDRLSRQGVAAWQGWRWPNIDAGTSKGVTMTGLRPTLWAGPDRFHFPDHRDLIELFDLQDLLDKHSRDMAMLTRCPNCYCVLGPAEDPYLIEKVLDRLLASGDDLLYFMAPMASPGVKQRRNLLRQGYNRYLVSGQIVEAEEVEESESWPLVEAMLVDAVSVRIQNRPRMREAVGTAMSLGNGSVEVRSVSGELWRHQTGQRSCLSCLRSFAAEALHKDRDDASALTVAELRLRLEPDVNHPAEARRKQLLFVLHLLEDLGFGGLPLLTRLDTLRWMERGALRLSQLFLQGDRGLILLVDEPFLGLGTAGADALRRAMVDTLAWGWTWVVVDRLEALAGEARQVWLLEVERAQVPLQRGRGSSPIDSIWPEWRGVLHYGTLRLDLGSGRWLEEKGDWGSKGDAPGFEPTLTGVEPNGFIPPIRISSPHQGVRWSTTHRHSVASIVGWDLIIAEQFALLPQSRVQGLGVEQIAGRKRVDQCPACLGLGVMTEHGIGRWSPECPCCRGTGVRNDPTAPRYRQLHYCDIMTRSVAEVAALFPNLPQLQRGWSWAEPLGLAEWKLSRRVWTLSQSERWLLTLWAHCARLRSGGLWIVEEPFMAVSSKQEDCLRTVFDRFVGLGGALVTLEASIDSLVLGESH